MDLGIAYGSDDEDQSMSQDKGVGDAPEQQGEGQEALVGPPPPAELGQGQYGSQSDLHRISSFNQFRANTTRYVEPPSGPGPARSDHFGGPALGPVPDSDNTTPFRREDSTPFVVDRGMGVSPLVAGQGRRVGPAPPGAEGEGSGGDLGPGGPGGEPVSYYDLLPPEIRDPPPGTCDPELQARVARWVELRRQGKHVTDEFRRFKDFRNPDFLTKMVGTFNIDCLGTSLAPSVWDPKAIPEEDTYEGLKRQMHEEQERRARELQQAQALRQAELGIPSAGGLVPPLPVSTAGPSVGGAGGVGGAALAAARAAAQQAQAAALQGKPRTSRWQ